MVSRSKNGSDGKLLEKCKKGWNREASYSFKYFKCSGKAMKFKMSKHFRYSCICSFRKARFSKISSSFEFLNEEIGHLEDLLFLITL